MSDEEKRVFNEMKTKFEIEDLLKKLRDGTITKEELERLKQLYKENNLKFSNDDLKKIKEAEERFLREELEELRKKLLKGELTEEEL